MRTSIAACVDFAKEKLVSAAFGSCFRGGGGGVGDSGGEGRLVSEDSVSTLGVSHSASCKALIRANVSQRTCIFRSRSDETKSGEFDDDGG